MIALDFLRSRLTALTRRAKSPYTISVPMQIKLWYVFSKQIVTFHDLRYGHEAYYGSFLHRTHVLQRYAYRRI